MLYYNHSYNAIAESKGHCPPKDWRNPPAIDMYNMILKTLSKEHNIPLIDTNDIMGALWDRSGDWNHYYDISSDMELMYILDRIFS